MLGPRNVQYAPKTPLIKGVNPSLYGFGYRPRFGSIEKHWQYRRSGKLLVLNLLTGQKSGFSTRRGDSLQRFTLNLAGPTGTWVRLAVQNFTSIGAGVGMQPKNIENFHFW